MLRFLARQPKSIAFMGSLLLLFGIAWVDLVTGYETSLVPLRQFDCLHRLALRQQRRISSSDYAVLFGRTDVMSGHCSIHVRHIMWEISIRFAFFFLVALAGIATKERHRASSVRIELLEHARRLEQQIIEVSEYEQQRIGRDLHDGLCQYLAAITCATSSLKIDLERGGLEKLAVTAAEIEKLLGESVKQARNLSHGLVPVQLDEAGLPAALQELAASTSRLLRMDCTFEFAGENGFNHPGKATHLYRMAQEAINNARKHGKANNVEVRLSANSSAMSLSIADNGTGFSKTEKDMNGVGLSIMRYRANVVGGEFEIEDAGRAAGRSCRARFIKEV